MFQIKCMLIWVVSRGQTPYAPRRRKKNDKKFNETLGPKPNVTPKLRRTAAGAPRGGTPAPGPRPGDAISGIGIVHKPNRPNRPRPRPKRLGHSRFRACDFVRFPALQSLGTSPDCLVLRPHGPTLGNVQVELTEPRLDWAEVLAQCLGKLSSHRANAHGSLNLKKLGKEYCLLNNQ